MSNATHRIAIIDTDATQAEAQRGLEGYQEHNQISERGFIRREGNGIWSICDITES